MSSVMEKRDQEGGRDSLNISNNNTAISFGYKKANKTEKKETGKNNYILRNSTPLASTRRCMSRPGEGVTK